MKTVIAIIAAGVLFASTVSAAEEKKDPVDEALSGIGDAYYISGDVGVPLPWKFSIAGHFGASIFSDADAEDYLDWSVGISRPVLGLDLTFAYVDNDLSRLDCGGEKKLCDSRFMFTVAESF